MDSPEKRLAGLIARLAPDRAKEFRAARKKMRALLPNATEIVYDYGFSIVIAYSPNDKAWAAIFALSARADRVELFLTQGPKLPDPTKRLHGSGKIVRGILLESAKTIDEPDVRALIDAALKLAKTPVAPDATHQIIIKAKRKTSAKAKTKTKTKTKAEARRS
ncbi:MAG TPA: hypothetical protein VFH33_07580 [Candidatus Krumholzibacteria bacterium]|nr:hypothetical protein [Candidatus Krumholzibacteria bacterium]